jgi:hypothetical protein
VLAEWVSTITSIGGAVTTVLAVAVDVLAGLKSVSTQCWRRHISVGGDYAGETGGCLVQPPRLIG